MTVFFKMKNIEWYCYIVLQISNEWFDGRQFHSHFRFYIQSVMIYLLTKFRKQTWSHTDMMLEKEKPHGSSRKGLRDLQGPQNH